MEITGDFEVALCNLIANIQDGNLSKEQMLAQWDKDRGTDWYTSTSRRQLDKISAWNQNHPYKGRQY